MVADLASNFQALFVADVSVGKMWDVNKLHSVARQSQLGLRVHMCLLLDPLEAENKVHMHTVNESPVNINFVKILI